MSAYRFVAQNGLCGWNEYPYTGVDGTCNNACTATNWISGGRVVAQPGDEVSLLAAIDSGPVATAVMAQIPTFQFYASGIYNDADCPKDFASLDHAVTLTGYGSENGNDYWWMKNSWDTTW
jgi:cathepsin L